MNTQHVGNKDTTVRTKILHLMEVKVQIHFVEGIRSLTGQEAG
jgi:hypothetical protein